MKKIGIITWYSNLNYGTVLQAYALQKHLKDNHGADAYLIAYLPNQENMLHTIEQKKEHLFYKLVQKGKKLINDPSKEYDALLKTEYKADYDKRVEEFNTFLSNIKFVDAPSDMARLEDEFDAFICGSDQIWNPHILDSNYYLNFVKSKPKLSYATSFGINYLPNYAKPYIKDYLNDYKAISLREATCKEELEKLCERDVKIVCDPTFLIDKNEWHTLSSEKNVNEKYILTYFLGDTELSNSVLNKVQNSGIKNVILPSTLNTIKADKDNNFKLSPSDFISLIENAEYIVTDSFHAVCFATIFEKNFCVLNKHPKNSPYGEFSRIENILDTIGAKDRIVTKSSMALDLMKKPISYNKLALNKLINSSKKYLKDNLE